MLVLTRHKNETIMIGDDIEISVLDIKGEQVRIGIQAPKQISIYRKEIYEAIQKENIEAAKMGTTDVGKLKDLLKPNDKKKQERHH